jgi:predicted RNA methylase
MSDSDTFSTVMLVDECLLDQRRTRAFEAAIRQAVRPGDVVMDAGTGSGILALFAARAGAQKVFAVELDPEVAAMTQRTFRANQEGRRISLISSDLRNVTLDRPVDVLVMELLDTGLINEQQAPALNALREHGVIGPQTVVIPQRAICTLQLVEYDFSFYEFAMPLIVQARNHGVLSRAKKRLSRTHLYRDVDFGKEIDTRVDEQRVVTVTSHGQLNALLLRTKIVLHAGISLWETSDMNMPIVVPVAPAQVSQGDRMHVAIGYEMGKGYGSLRVDIHPLGHRDCYSSPISTTTKRQP